ncbi:MAG: hypothetical protein HY362_02345 [Candidatus Aenigmarchaeota archaeon]|nr:hypothetical protein [Candidatus Aenigmarchaeota archaeon]
MENLKVFDKIFGSRYTPRERKLILEELRQGAHYECMQTTCGYKWTSKEIEMSCPKCKSMDIYKIKGKNTS